MKQFLILLSSITTLAISSNTFANCYQNTTFFTNSLQTNKNNANQNSLFNNQYGYLSTSDWITNQSTADHKFDSYDTSELKNYTFTNSKDVFLVDTTGNLVYNPQVTIPNEDKTDIENTMQEMINCRKIATIKDDYNPYSKSQYSTSYFDDDNQNWKYIQFGEIEKHIDISQQAGGYKVEHSDSLSETLGIYYIAKAVIENKISNSVAINLAKYFIEQSSLKDKLNKILIDNMINLISNDNKIYDFIFNAPLSNNDKNYSLNWIFDNNNNLVEVYYNKFDKSNIKNNLNYHYYYWTYVFFGTINDSSDTFNLLNWKKYAPDWDTFIKIFPTFVFDKDSYVNLSVNNHGSSKLTNLKTKDILTNQGAGNTNSLYNISVPYRSGRYHFKEVFDLNIWHDNENIYFKWFLSAIQGGSEYTINLNNINFINIMN